MFGSAVWPLLAALCLAVAFGALAMGVDRFIDMVQQKKRDRENTRTLGLRRRRHR